MSAIANSPLPDATRGSIQCCINNTTYLLQPGVDGAVLTPQANAANGSGLQWVTDLDLVSLAVVFGLTAGTVNASGTIGAFGSTGPSSQPAFPGTATGTDAAVINAIVTFLAAYGFCASS